MDARAEVMTWSRTRSFQKWSHESSLQYAGARASMTIRRHNRRRKELRTKLRKVSAIMKVRPLRRVEAIMLARGTVAIRASAEQSPIKRWWRYGKIYEVAQSRIGCFVSFGRGLSARSCFVGVTVLFVRFACDRFPRGFRTSEWTFRSSSQMKLRRLYGC